MNRDNQIDCLSLKFIWVKSNKLKAEEINPLSPYLASSWASWTDMPNAKPSSYSIKFYELIFRHRHASPSQSLLQLNEVLRTSLVGQLLPGANSWDAEQLIHSHRYPNFWQHRNWCQLRWIAEDEDDGDEGCSKNQHLENLHPLRSPQNSAVSETNNIQKWMIG